MRLLRGSSLPARLLKGPALGALRAGNGAIRAVAQRTHALQQRVEWQIPPTPEWYDHYLDVHAQWPTGGGGFFMERGVFDSLAIDAGARVLDLCCGDGFNARHFYAPRASQVIAVDFDGAAIRHARRWNRHPVIEYVRGDIRDELPLGPFDNVVWDAAIEHFTEEEITAILRGIRERLGEGGILSGYTMVGDLEAGKMLVHHEREFTGAGDLLRFLERVFPAACVLETVHPERRNLYFYAAEDVARIPLAPTHSRIVWSPAP